MWFHKCLPHISSQSLVYLIILVQLAYTARSGEKNHQKRHRGHNDLGKRKRMNRHNSNLAEKPNIVIIMTDDQDEILGSMNVMPKTLKILGDEGTKFKNSFVTTPMCCPSRSTFLTGMYVHNHNTYTNNANCSSREWQRTHETRNFATYLKKAGYRTGFFGKYLNEYNGTYIPPGWQEWMGLVHNSRFYNYTLNVNGRRVRHGFNYEDDYLTDLIANNSIRFLQDSRQNYPDRPVLMVLTVPAPHGPEDAAPQYSHLFSDVTTHRTASWDHAPNPDKQWLLQHVGKMQPIHKKFTDVLQQKRLQTLQSVDDAVHKLYNELKNVGVLDNTYIVYTSDHGYHLGQYGLLKGKAMPYEFDIRVPFYIRGPGVPKGKSIADIVLNLDLAPTFLDMAGVAAPDHMDGRSIMKLIRDAQQEPKQENRRQPYWRDTFLVERGKITKDKLSKRFSIKAAKDRLEEEKQMRLLSECARAEYKFPCNGNQLWQCETDKNGKLKMVPCKSKNELLLGDKTDCNQGKKGTKTYASFSLEKKSNYIVVDTPANSNLDDPFSFEEGSNHQEVPTGQTSWSYTHLHQQHLVDDYEFDEWYTLKYRQDEMMNGYSRALQQLKEVSANLNVHMREFPNASSIEIGKQKKDNTTDCDDCDKTIKPTTEPTYPATKPTQKTAKPTQPQRKKKLTKAERRLLRRESRRRRRNKSKNRRNQRSPGKPKKESKRNNPDCKVPGVECNIMNNDHWKVFPRWTYGPFCYCSNSQNNTYWCVRTLNDTHDFLYCEFISGFLSFYDMKTDPHQLQNVVHQLSFDVLQNLHNTLIKLQSCKGYKECHIQRQTGEPKTEADILFEGSGEVSFSGDVTSDCPDPNFVDKDAEEFLKITTGLRLDN